MNNAGQTDDILLECASVGAAVLAAQRIEFLLYGLSAHVKPELKSGDKRFRDLTPEGFLRGDPAELRATLGQLAKAFGPKFLLSSDDLEEFVRARNLIVHDYWRMSKARIRDGRRLESPLTFLLKFLHDCQHWEGILRGVLVTMKLSAATSADDGEPLALTQEALDYMDEYHRHVHAHLIRDLPQDSCSIRAKREAGPKPPT